MMDDFFSVHTDSLRVFCALCAISETMLHFLCWYSGEITWKSPAIVLQCFNDWNLSVALMSFLRFKNYFYLIIFHADQFFNRLELLGMVFFNGRKSQTIMSVAFVLISVP